MLFRSALSDLAEELRQYEGESIYISGDGYNVTWRALSAAGIDLTKTPELLILQNAVSVARVACRMHERGETVSDIELSPVYLRMPQAERERLEREAARKD